MVSEMSTALSADFPCFIFARGGSKGLPGKNIREIAGRPLICWSIDAARDSGRFSRIIVSTDSPEIADVARGCGAEVPYLRPSHLAEDSSPEVESWRHAISEYREIVGHLPPLFVSLPTTSPTRSVADVHAALDLAFDRSPDLVVAVTPSHRSPFFNVLVEDGDHLRLFDSSVKVTRRQDAPSTWDLTTVIYVARPEHVLTCDRLLDGTTMGVVVPKERAVDIDDEWDFALAEAILARRSNQMDDR